MEPLIEGEKFARRCSITGEGMNEGWVFGDGDIYIKYLKDAEELAFERGSKDLQEAFDDNDAFFTDWIEEDDEYIVKNGRLTKIEEEVIVSEAKLKVFEVFKNGTAESTLFAKNQTEAEDLVFAAYGEFRTVCEVEEDENDLLIERMEKASYTPKTKTNATAWDFVEKYHPNYSSSDDICRALDINLILERRNTIMDEEGTELHTRYMKEFKGQIAKVELEYDFLLKEIYEESIENFIKINGGL